MSIALTELDLNQLDLVQGGAATSEVLEKSLADLMVGAGLSRALGGAGAAFGEGLAIGLGAGGWLGPAGAVIGTVAGVAITWYLISERKRTTTR